MIRDYFCFVNDTLQLTTKTVSEFISDGDSVVKLEDDQKLFIDNDRGVMDCLDRQGGGSDRIVTDNEGMIFDLEDNQ